MKSADTPFVGGPLDGRVLPVLLGPTGHPPKTYRVPVPDAAGGEPTVLVYRRVQYGRGGPPWLSQGWRYEFDAAGDTGGRGPRWPWSRPAPAASRTPPGAAAPDATPEDGGDRSEG
ncbi:hypothetical protein QFZ63_002941 [Streptomyces sp. B3I7]|uniref:hypothetical protein n=1 Tax=unclassified Streptomyces TaxID=2593676 RepID=UPI00278ADF2E|nr:MULTISPECIES: hypothetical protein [unclassified Streptomyces]MDQ0789154.1 hypothetical protein [Streptomyces sp. B3I8]MDQ0811227.1 hypothetical protein [Streptomyces sp. B3I7]